VELCNDSQLWTEEHFVHMNVSDLFVKNILVNPPCAKTYIDERLSADYNIRSCFKYIDWTTNISDHYLGVKIVLSGFKVKCDIKKT